MTLQEYREKAGKLGKQLRDVVGKQHKEGYEWTGEDQQEYERLSKEYEECRAAGDRMARSEKIDAEMNAIDSDPDIGREDTTEQRGTDRDAPTAEDRRDAFAGWARANSPAGPSDRQREAADRVSPGMLGRNGFYLNLATREQIQAAQTLKRLMRHTATVADYERALGITPVDVGGALVPEGFIPRLEMNMLAFGGIMEVAEIIRTDGGGDLPWPTSDDTSNSGRRIAENAAVAELDPTTGQFILHAHKYTSDVVKVPFELLEDSAIDLSVLIPEMLGQRLGRIFNSEATTGAGGGMPQGIVTGATLGVTAAAVNAITYDEILALEHSVDPAYRGQVGVGWMFHDNVLLKLRQLQDGNGNGIWQQGLIGGAPDTLLNKPYTINQNMSSTITTTDKTMLFGLLSNYKVRQVRGIRFYRLEERYRDNDQDGFLAFVRRDGGLLDAGTAPVKYLQQA